MKIHYITLFKWRHPIPSFAVAWNSEYDGHLCMFLACVAWWKWCVVFSWSKPNNGVTGAAELRTVDAGLADPHSGYACTMDADCMPECCAQWRFDGKCANTGGDCKFRKPANKGSTGPEARQ